MKRSRKKMLRLVSGGDRASPPAVLSPTPAEVEPPVVMNGGLFSEMQMPKFEMDDDLDGEIFFTLPDILARLHEAVQFGELEPLARRLGVEESRLVALLSVIRDADAKLLVQLKLAFGIARATDVQDQLALA